MTMIAGDIRPSIFTAALLIGVASWFGRGAVDAGGFEQPVSRMRTGFLIDPFLATDSSAVLPGLPHFESLEFTVFSLIRNSDSRFGHSGEVCW